MDEQYCLKWGSHTEAITDIAYKFLEHESLVDVTLVCQEFNQTHFFKAHQIILSACSPYFESLFLNNSHPHPIVFLTDIKKKELETILMFMYRGEVNVQHDKIKDILNTAKSLMVRGLCDSVCETNSSNPPQDMKRSQSTERVSPKRRKYEENGRMADNLDEEYDDDYETKYSQCNSPTACYSSPIIRKLEPVDCADVVNSNKDDPMDYSMENCCRNESTNQYHLNSRAYEDDKSNIRRSYSVSPDAEYSTQKSNYASHEDINVNNEKMIIRKVNSTSEQCRTSSSQEISVIQANSSSSENVVPAINYTNVIPQHQLIGPKRVGHFQSKWMELFNWLQYDKESKKMYCKFCRKWGDLIPNIRRTSFVDGSCNFRFEIVKHHDCSKSHQICVNKDESNDASDYKF